MRAKKEKHEHTKNDKEKGTGITNYTGQKKIGEGHSIERVWHSASREPSDTLPGSQPCTEKRVASTTFRTLRVSVSLTAQSTSLRESLGWPNQRGSKTSQACYSHPRCNLNLVRLFRFSLLLPLIGRIFLFAHPRGHKPTTPFLYRVLYHAPELSAAVLQSPVTPNSRRSSATQSVYTSRGHTGGRSHRTSPPSFCGACLNFLARRVQPFLSLVNRDVDFCVLTINY